MSTPRDLKTVLDLPTDMTVCFGTRANGKRCSRGLSRAWRDSLGLAIERLSAGDLRKIDRESLKGELNFMARAAFCSRDHSAQRPAAAQDWLNKIDAVHPLAGGAGARSILQAQKDSPQDNRSSHLAKGEPNAPGRPRRNRQRVRIPEPQDDQDFLLMQLQPLKAPGGPIPNIERAREPESPDSTLPEPPTPRPTKRFRHTEPDEGDPMQSIESLERQYTPLYQRASDKKPLPVQQDPKPESHTEAGSQRVQPAFDIYKPLPIRSRQQEENIAYPLVTPGWPASPLTSLPMAPRPNQGPPPLAMDPEPRSSAFEPLAYQYPRPAEIASFFREINYHRPTPAPQASYHHHERHITGAWPSHPFQHVPVAAPAPHSTSPQLPELPRMPQFFATPASPPPAPAAQSPHHTSGRVLRFTRDPTDTFYILHQPSTSYHPTAHYDPLHPSRLPLGPLFLQRANYFLCTQDPDPFTSKEVAFFGAMLAAEEERSRVGRKKVMRKKVEGECPICLEEMDADGKEGIVWCEWGCGNNFHAECLGAWRSGGMEGRGRCVVCSVDL